MNTIERLKDVIKLVEGIKHAPMIPELEKKIDGDNYYTGIYRTSDYIAKLLNEALTNKPKPSSAKIGSTEFVFLADKD